MKIARLDSVVECAAISSGDDDRESKRFARQKKRKSSTRKRIKAEKKRRPLFGLMLVVAILAVIVASVGWYVQQASQGPSDGTSNGSRIISVDDDPYLGPEDALVTIVEFSDYQCSSCAIAARVVKNMVNNEFAGQVKLVYRDFPMRGIHSHADVAAEAAQSAFEQGRFWEYHDLLFERQLEWGNNDLTREEVETLLKDYAMELGLDMEQFSTSLETGRYAEEVQNDRLDGLKYGVRETPTFFINGEKIEEKSESAIRDAINRALSG